MALSYETAKKLQDAGLVWSKEYGELDPARSETFPTLSELIEACWDKILGIHKDITDERWIADSKSGANGEIGWFHAEGDSPEEAVAKLWLMLNQDE